MPKHTINKAEFYITNVCNLTCDHCNRFNNYKFTGWQRWQDYQAVYQQWGQVLDIKQITVLGGEPLLNPTILEWIYGLSEIWQEVQVLTNGTRINHVPGLYEALYRKRAWLGISLHNLNELEAIECELEQFMTVPIRRTVLDPVENQGDFVYQDSVGIEIRLWIQNQFQQSAIKINDQGQLTLHSSDPDQAHSLCSFAQWQCYHFISGQLYKCGPVALFDQFDQQHNLHLSPEDRELIKSYRPLSIDQWADLGHEFLQDLDNAIPQCKFCPDYVEVHTIAPVRKVANG